MPSAGRCINCNDKPKFGGAGIRKQSCIFRRCERPQRDWDENPESPEAQPLSGTADLSAAQLPPATIKEPITEEESLFWGAVQVLQGSGPRQQQCAPSLCGLQSKLKGNRCGECLACNRDDCGSCLNCRDKPRFGGRGARKQACVMRTCATPWLGSGTSEPDEAEELSDSTSSDEIASPLGLHPSQPLTLPPPLPPGTPRGGEQADATVHVNGAVVCGGARGHPAQPAFPQVQMMPPKGLSPPPMQPHGPHMPMMLPVVPAGQPTHLSSLKSAPPLKSAPLHATKPYAGAFELSNPSSIASTARRPTYAAAPRSGSSAAGDLGGFSFGVEWLRKYEAATRALAERAPAEAFFGKDVMLREARMLGGIGALPRDAMLHERQRVVAAVVRVER